MKKLKQIMALIGSIVLVVLVVMTLFFAITGSKYFYASLVAMIFVPIFLYGAMVVFKALK